MIGPSFTSIVAVRGTTARSAERASGKPSPGIASGTPAVTAAADGTRAESTRYEPENMWSRTTRGILRIPYLPAYIFWPFTITFLLMFVAASIGARTWIFAPMGMVWFGYNCGRRHVVRRRSAGIEDGRSGPTWRMSEGDGDGSGHAAARWLA